MRRVGFPFFCDFSGELARAVTEGRRSEFASLWRDVACDSVPGPATEAARAAAVLDWTALAREPHKSAHERARHRLALRRRELAPRLPAEAGDGTLLGPATLTARWSLADGATLTLAANLADQPFPAPPAAPRPALARDDRHGRQRVAAVVRRVDASNDAPRFAAARRSSRCRVSSSARAALGQRHANGSPQDSARRPARSPPRRFRP